MSEQILRKKKRYPIQSVDTRAWQLHPARCDRGVKVFRGTPVKTNPNWIYQVKYDGTRYLWQLHPNGAANHFLTSRIISTDTGLLSEKQDVAVRMRDHPTPRYYQNTIIDGEIVPLDGPEMSSEAVKALHSGRFKYVVYDLPMLCGDVLVLLPYSERLKRLKRLLKALWTPEWVSLAEMVRLPEDVYAYCDGRNIEGLVGKDPDGFYGEEWVKLKLTRTYDIVVMGVNWSESDRYAARGWIKSLQIGQYKNGKLSRFGNLTGMDESVRASVSADPSKFVGKVVEIEAQRRFSTGWFQNPRFVRWRADKPKKECVFRPDEV